MVCVSAGYKHKEKPKRKVIHVTANQISGMCESTYDSSKSRKLESSQQRSTLCVELPSYAPSCNDSDVKLEFRMLAALQKSSDEAGNAAMAVLADAHKKLGIFSKKQKRTLNAVYNDKDLGGGGYKAVKARIYENRNYCVNPELVHGKLTCQRLLPKSHVGGACPTCGHATQDIINGRQRFLSTDHFINLGEYYKIIFETTDIAQRICDYYHISRERLSTPLDNMEAKVRCVESAWVARSDFYQHQERFCLDVEAKPGEKAWLRREDGKASLVLVVEELDNSYIVRTLISRTVVEEVSKEMVKKLVVPST